MIEESTDSSPTGAADGRRRSSRVQSLKVGATSQILPLTVGYGFNLLATPYVVSQLGLREFGIWAMTGALAQYATLLDLGASRAANRYVALFHARGETDKDRSVVGICVSVALGLGVVLGLIALLGAGIGEKLLHTGDVAFTRFLLLSAVAILTCGLVARILAGASFGRGRQLPPNIGLAVLGVTQVLSGVVALAIEPTLRNYALGASVGAALGLGAVAVIIFIDEGRIAIGRPRMALAREVIVFGLHSQVAGATDVVLFQSGKLIAGIVIGPAAAGAYDLGIRLIQGVQAFGGAASVAINTHLTRAYSTTGMAGIREQYSRLTRRAAAVVIFPPFLLGATAFSAVPLWLGGPHPQVLAIASALAFGIAVNVSTAVTSASVYAIGRPGLIGAWGAGYVTALVIVAIPLTMTFGFTALVVAYACWIPVGNVLGAWFLQSRVGIPMTEFFKAVGGPFAVAILATAVALPINLIAAPVDRAHAIAPFLASSLVFCAVYIALGLRLDYLPRISGVARLRGAAPAPQPSASEGEILNANS